MIDKVKEQPTNGTLTPTEARATLEAGATNEEPPASPDVTPQEVLKQVLALAESLGYQLGIVALMPKTGTPVPIVEYLPDGVKVAIMPFKKSLDGN